MLFSKIDRSNIYFYLVLVYAFTLPLSHAAISFFSILIPLIWLLEGNLKEKFLKVFSNRVSFFLIIFLLYSSISIFWSSNMEVAFNVLRMYGYFLTMFAIYTTIDKKYFSKIVSAFLFGMFVSEIIAYGVFWGLWRFKHATVYNPTPFMMHIDYSVFLAFSSILLLHRVLSNIYSIKEKILYLFFFLTVTGNLFLSIGRTGQVAYVFAVFVLMILKYRVKIKSFFYAILLLLVLFISAYNVSDTFKIRVNMAKTDIQQIYMGDLNTSWGIRVAYWIVSYEVFKEYPFGVGLGDYKDIVKVELEKEKYSFLDKKTKDFMKDSHPHNQYLLILLQTGIIGIILFMCFVFQTFKIEIENREIKNLSILFLTVFYISCFAEPLFLKQFTLNLFVLFLSLFLSVSNSYFLKE